MKDVVVIFVNGFYGNISISALNKPVEKIETKSGLFFKKATDRNEKLCAVLGKYYTQGYKLETSNGDHYYQTYILAKE